MAKKARKTDRRQNPSAKTAHRAIQRANRKRRLAPPKKRRKARKRQPKPPPREIDVISAIEEAYIEIETLAQEMRDWADSMEEKFSGTQKYDTVNSTADTLENMTNPAQSDEYDFLKKVKITVQDPTPRARGFSRSARCGQATDLLEQVVSALEAFDDRADFTDAEKEKAGELNREIDDHVSDLQGGVEFPGMYG